MTDQYNEQTSPEAEHVEEVEATAEEAAHLAAGEKFAPEQFGEAVLKFATETAYAAAGVANVLAEKAKEFYEAQRKQIAEKTPEGVDPNFRQFVDSMPEQFKSFMDEANKAFHDMAERGRSSVADFQGQVQAARDAARDARANSAEAFDLDDDASATAEAADAVAPEESVGETFPEAADDHPQA